jgi:hypothetical protein
VDYLPDFFGIIGNHHGTDITEEPLVITARDKEESTVDRLLDFGRPHLNFLFANLDTSTHERCSSQFFHRHRIGSPIFGKVSF